MKSKVKTIEYIDATPAAGKTREARRIISKHILTADTSVIVYAAPTHTLIDEVVSSLRDTVWEEDYDAKVVRLHGKTSTVQYSYLMGLISESAAAKVIEPSVFRRLKARKPTCRVVLCTHECLIRAPKGETEISRKATVLFDEARNCVLKDLEIRVSTKAIAKITSVFSLREAVRSKDAVIVDGASYVSNVFTLQSANFPSTQALMARFGATELNSLPSYVLSLHKMKSMCAGGRADVLIETLTPVDKGSSHAAYIVGLSRPSSIFEGYGRVIVMSAYFTHSQMYHLLLNAHVGHQQGSHVFKLVPYKASDLFQERSRLVTENSLKNIRIGALLTGTQSGRLTSSFLSSGLVVTPSLNDALKERASLKKAEVIRRAFSKEDVPGLTARENKTLHACGNPPLLALHRIAYSAMKEANVKAALCFTNALGSGSQGSTYRIGGEKVMDSVDFLMNAPHSLTADHYEAARNFLTEPMLRHVGQSSKRIFFRIPKSTSVLGLNAYDKLEAFVHLAALNPKPAVTRVLKRVLPNYEPDLDYAISNIIQTMYRTSLRKPESSSEVVCMVLTEWIIEQIERVCFNGQKLRRINGYQPRFTELNYKLEDKAAKSKAGKAKRVDIPNEIRMQIQKLQSRASAVTKKTLEKKISGLIKIAKEFPASEKNINKWIQKYKMKGPKSTKIQGHNEN